MFDKNLDGAKKIAGEIKRLRLAASTSPTTRRSAKAIAQFEKEVGPTDILVNNAGWDQFVPFVDTTPELWDKIIAINLHGPLNMSHVVLKGMVAAATAAWSTSPPMPAASAPRWKRSTRPARAASSPSPRRWRARWRARASPSTPSAPARPTRPCWRPSPAHDERGQKIRAALVSAIPMKRVGQPDDIPGAVCFLASDDAAFITGQTISVSGGLTMHG